MLIAIPQKILHWNALHWKSWQRWSRGGQALHVVICATVLAVLLVPWWFTSAHLRTQGAQVDEAARLQQAGLATVISESLRQIVEKAQLASIVAQQGLQGAGVWKQQLEHMLLRDPVFMGYALTDAAGTLIAGRMPERMAQQLHTVRASHCPQSAVLALEPEQAQASADHWVVPLLLCMSDYEGQAQGYLLLYTDIGYFLSLYRDMALGRSGIVHLLADDGHAVAAMSQAGVLPQPVQLSMELGKNWVTSVGEQEVALVDARARLAKYHRAAHMPLTVVVSREWQEIRADHQQQMRRSWWLLGGISVLALGVTVVLVRMLQRRQHLYEALAWADQDKQQLIAQLESEKQRALDLASCDHLTGLHNRRMFHELVSSHLALARRSRKHYALLYIDLDWFKQINDSLGHHVGDALLQAVAQRLRSMLRSSDIIARMGGDEFAVLVTALEHMSDMDALAQKLVKGLSAPYEGLDTAPIHTSPSIGIAFFPRDGHDVDMLCRHADVAMYASKKAGRSRYTYYDRVPSSDNERSLRLARQLPMAIAQDQMVLHFQPKVRLEDYALVGFEALVRWQHPEYGLIYPGEFIALAEEHGHVDALGDWVMQACCRQIAAWRMQGLDLVPLAFNVSALQLDSAFPVRLSSCLQHYSVRPAEIQVEMTESCLVDAQGVAVRVLAQLKQMGVRIALDDFGTGFSSLSQIRDLPIHTIKLDKSFVNELRSSKEAGVLVTSIITLAHNLRMQVVAEGVELMDQLVYLKTAGCDVAQGYFISRPVPVAKAEAILRQGALELVPTV